MKEFNLGTDVHRSYGFLESAVICVLNAFRTVRAKITQFQIYLYKEREKSGAGSWQSQSCIHGQKAKSLYQSAEAI